MSGETTRCGSGHILIFWTYWATVLLNILPAVICVVNDLRRDERDRQGYNWEM